eukprot:CAMPEP_0172693504 /NCGR_PEP_ID=MMETSP1074-20121228/26038_1 /TAXON_ID=2916 /ORGANISM="Ceratium fusus, Strain PA161109" /LENGTH=189 /DNA_ID=CAMNT_0013513881 /DNA_START=29 /DNA_END=595 /DNA_ORIENTATION=-
MAAAVRPPAADRYAMSASEQPPQEAQAEDEDSEELEDVPADEKEGDPLLGVQIRRTVPDGQVFEATVEEIERGKISGERLYRIRYSDGDLEHLSAPEVEDCLIPAAQEEGSKLPTVMRKPAAIAAPAEDVDMAGDDQEADEEDEAEEEAEAEEEDKPPAAARKKPAGSAKETSTDIADDGEEEDKPPAA